jgi:hypothetical protein
MCAMKIDRRCRSPKPRKFGRLDILVNNAAIGSNIPMRLEDRYGAVGRFMTGNVRGTFRVKAIPLCATITARSSTCPHDHASACRIGCRVPNKGHRRVMARARRSPPSGEFRWRQDW